MDRPEALARLDMITDLMRANICLLDRIVKGLPKDEKFLDDQLCNVIGSYMAVHNSLVMTIRAVSDPTVGQYPSIVEQLTRSVQLVKNKVVPIDSTKPYLGGAFDGDSGGVA